MGGIAIIRKTTQLNPIIYILSDSVGDTAEKLAKAAASQFDFDHLEIRRVPFLNSVQQLEDALTEVKQADAIIVYTLVFPALRAALAEKIHLLGLTAIDAMGPIISTLENVYHLKPQNQPGLIYKIDGAYFKKVEAIEFAVKFDDGKDAQGILKAEIVIVGVSRTSKTPLCIYLAHKGYKAVNVPLIPEVEVPEELFKVPVKQIVGLTIKPSRLLEIRNERLESMGISKDLSKDVDYANYSRILAELDYADAVMRKIGCPVIDVTSKGTEETAAKVLEFYRRGVE